MGVQILSPRFSFVRFCEDDDSLSCSRIGSVFNLPIYSFDDIAFQFIAVADTDGEADAMCDLANDLATVGLVSECEDDFTLNFKTALSLKPERFRIGEKSVLFNWSHGIPGFDNYFEVGQCFRIKVSIDHPIAGLIECCSNKLERINEDCRTSVVEYGSDQNIYGFNYCGTGELEEEDESPCEEPTIMPFSNATELNIAYTAEMQEKYGVIPTVEIFILDGGQYIKPIIRVGFDAYPPTTIIADLGGEASGYIKIS